MANTSVPHSVEPRTIEIPAPRSSAHRSGFRDPISWNPSTRLISAAALIVADALAWMTATVIIYMIRVAIWGHIPFYWGLYPTAIGWLIFRAASGLYPPAGISPPEELRRSFRTTASAAVVHLAVLAGVGELDSWRVAALSLWLFVFPIAYFYRSFAKLLLLRHRLFGEPYVVIGIGPTGKQLLREILRNSELGIIPVAAFGNVSEYWGEEIEGVPVIGPIDAAPEYSFPYPIRHVIIALGNTPANREREARLIKQLLRTYPSVQTLAHVADTSNLLVLPRAIGAFLALEVHQPRLSARQRTIKRILDLTIAVPAFCLAAPVITIAAIAVKIVSPGPAFFRQVREGAQGRPIRIWKIRTMVVNAEQRLAEYLSSNPTARYEYERTLKLRSDPRIIPKVGRFLRRMSIDELPQLLSVIRGDLSLVGPRVMLGHEVERFSLMGQELRRQVPPGVTGFWQVLYRNNSDLQIWEEADSYYVNNWSIWLDLWIMLRTARVVLTGAGAY
jgi:Undecaprenyl-phosphate galactose phosphotransferase WbaP